MKTFDILREHLLKKSSSSNYALEKSQLKSEFTIMCNKYLSTPDEALVFTVASGRDLNTFLDIIDDAELLIQFQITQEEKDIFKVQLKDLNLV